MTPGLSVGGEGRLSDTGGTRPDEEDLTFLAHEKTPMSCAFLMDEWCTSLWLV